MNHVVPHRLELGAHFGSLMSDWTYFALIENSVENQLLAVTRPRSRFIGHLPVVWALIAR